MRFLDTCVCVDFLRGRLKLGYELMRNSNPADFRLPSIVVAELWYGAEHSKNPSRELSVVEEFVGSFEIAPFDGDSAREYGRIRQQLNAKGLMIGDRDMMIAACALVNQATLVTNNTNEFKRVKGLRLESWHELSTGE